VKSASIYGTVSQVSVQPTPQHDHKRIGRVTHSGRAAPCGQGGSQLMGGKRCREKRHFDSSVDDVHLKGTKSSNHKVN